MDSQALDSLSLISRVRIEAPIPNFTLSSHSLTVFTPSATKSSLWLGCMYFFFFFPFKAVTENLVYHELEIAYRQTCRISPSHACQMLNNSFEMLKFGLQGWS